MHFYSLAPEKLTFAEGRELAVTDLGEWRGRAGFWRTCAHGSWWCAEVVLQPAALPTAAMLLACCQHRHIWALARAGAKLEQQNKKGETRTVTL